MLDHMDLRRQVVEWALAMNTTGLVVQTSGNVSARVPGTDMMLVTPTGTPYHLLKPEDVVLMSCDGKNVPDGQLLPTRWVAAQAIFCVLSGFCLMAHFPQRVAIPWRLAARTA